MLLNIFKNSLKNNDIFFLFSIISFCFFNLFTPFIKLLFVLGFGIISSVFVIGIWFCFSVCSGFVIGVCSCSGFVIGVCSGSGFVICVCSCSGFVIGVCSGSGVVICVCSEFVICVCFGSGFVICVCSGSGFVIGVCSSFVIGVCSDILFGFNFLFKTLGFNTFTRPPFFIFLTDVLYLLIFFLYFFVLINLLKASINPIYI